MASALCTAHLWLCLLATLVLSLISFGCSHPQVLSQGNEIEIVFRSSLDSSLQKAVVYVSSQGSDSPRPLLVVAHYLGGNRFTARDIGYYPEMQKRSWLLVCPELHGRRTPGQTSLSALEAQRDVIDAIQEVRKSYQVDSTRIYIAGRSMGGMLTGMMAAKYPDMFAAAVAGQGISDLKAWIHESPRFNEDVQRECGVWSDSTAFDYARRSSINFAPNLALVPIMFWHGTNDTWVIPEQSSRLHSAILQFNRYLPPVTWLSHAPHCGKNASPQWICDQLAPYENVCEAGEGVGTRFLSRLDIVTDESKRYYWLEIGMRNQSRFARAQARIAGDTVVLALENCARAGIHEQRLPVTSQATFYRVTTDSSVLIQVIRRDGSRAESHVAGSRNGAF